MDSRDVLIDFDNFLNAFDVLKVCAAAIPFPDVLEFGRGNDVEGHAGALTTPNHAIWDFGRRSLLLPGGGSAPGFEATATAATCAQAGFDSDVQHRQDGAVLRGGRRVGDNDAFIELVAPSIAELSLIGGQKLRRRHLRELPRRRVHAHLRRHVRRIRAAWPTVDELKGAAGGDALVLKTASEVLGAIRRAKTTEKRSMRAKVRRLTVSGPPDVLAAVDAARGDLIDAGGVELLELEEAAELSVAVELAEEA